MFESSLEVQCPHSMFLHHFKLAILISSGYHIFKVILITENINKAIKVLKEQPFHSQMYIAPINADYTGWARLN
jgi:hypothetical protein